MASSRSGLPIAADTAALTRLARSLRQASPAAYKAYKRALREAAEVILKDAQSRASFSTQIPPSGHVRITPGGNAVIVFDAPDAAPIENQGKGHVRHPVFGNRAVWTDKNSHDAFASPALDAHADETVAAVMEAITNAVADAIDEGGF